MSDEERVDQGDIELNDGDCNRKITEAFYPTPDLNKDYPPDAGEENETDTRIDFITGEPIP